MSEADARLERDRLKVLGRIEAILRRHDRGSVPMAGPMPLCLQVAMFTKRPALVSYFLETYRVTTL